MSIGSESKPGSPSTAGRSRKTPAAVITAAAPSYDDQLRSRRNRYALMMGLRVPCLVLAALLYQTPWLAVTIAALSIPLPWMAVLIANDRPALKRRRMAPVTVNPERALPAGTHEIVEGRTGPDPR